MNKQEEKTLNKIIQINLDSSKIYRIAAENSSDPNIQTFFDQVAINREENMRKALAKTGDSETDPSLKAELQQFWINLKSAKKEFNATALIDECLDAEKQYYDEQKELEATPNLSEDIKSMISREKKEAGQNISQLKEHSKEFKKIDNNKNRETPV